jgi:hypothetical protein
MKRWTIVGDDCEPEGTTGEWWAANGTSDDWQNWQIDLAGPDGRFYGKQVEVSITYVSDWATQGLGVFVDEISVSTGEGTTPSRAGTTAGRCLQRPQEVRRTRIHESSRTLRDSPRAPASPGRARCSGGSVPRE